MAKQIIKYHAAGVLVLPNKDDGRLLLGKYDEGYPVEFFRNHLKLPFGGICRGDISPREILIRETTEELKIPQEI